MKTLRHLAASSVLIVFLAAAVLAGDMQGAGVAPPPPRTNSVVEGNHAEGCAATLSSGEASGEIVTTELTAYIISLFLSIF